MTVENLVAVTTGAPPFTEMVSAVVSDENPLVPHSGVNLQFWLSINYTAMGGSECGSGGETLLPASAT